ncbi:hypothetical protein [Amaricoccus solimangrovi]|nr:hypothetical protein [Amaricoccus solimangrovi]
MIGLGIGISTGSAGLAIGGDYLIWTADDDSLEPLVWTDGAGNLQILTWS